MNHLLDLLVLGLERPLITAALVTAALLLATAARVVELLDRRLGTVPPAQPEWSP